MSTERPGKMADPVLVEIVEGTLASVERRSRPPSRGPPVRR
ncbi:hypothetical protein ACFQX6_62435 [Streptosporangium lutulentum]